MASATKIRAIFSDLDGTIVHFSQWFQRHGVRILPAQVSRDPEPSHGSVPLPSTREAAPQADGASVSVDTVDETVAMLENDVGERRRCRVLPMSTMGPGYVSDRTVELVDELREHGVLFVIVTAARKSTVLERLPFLPRADAVVSECGTRILYGGELDEEWALRFRDVSGPLDTDVPPEMRTEPLWALCAEMRAAGLKVDSRSYYGCFRVDSEGRADKVDLIERFRERLPASITSNMNLGKYDFFPAVCGKGNAVRYLQAKFGVDKASSAALFDDDNDLPMAEACGSRFVPALTSSSIVEAVRANPSWIVAQRCGQGVFAIEELLAIIAEGAIGPKASEEASAKAGVPA